MADQYWNNVVLAMPMDGANASTTFTDLKGKVITPTGNAQISTAQSKFGGASAYFDGAGDYLSTPNSEGFDFGSGDFTLELWIRTTQSAGLRGILSKRTTGGATGTNWLLVIDSGALKAYFSDGTTYQVNSVGGGSVSDGNWHHCSVTRSGSTFRIFVDGSQVASATWSGTISSTSRPQYIGTDHPNNDSYFNGYIDEVRITKGVARYTDNFTPPSLSFFNRFDVSAGLAGLYSDIPVMSSALLGMYSMVLEQAVSGRYQDASQLQVGLVGRYGDSSHIISALSGRYGDTLSVMSAIDGRYGLMHSVLSGMEGRYSTTGTEVLSALEGRYDLRERNDITAALVSYYSLLPGATLQNLACPVLIGGVAVKWSAVQWTVSESSYLIEATISLRDGAEFGSISKNDQVTIAWQGTVYTLFVATKLRSRSVSGSPGAVDYGVDYTIVARSLTAGLDEPYALPTTLSWPAATMQSAIAAQLIAPLSDIISLDWRLEDQLQPGGTFFLTDETPLVGLRKLAGIVGGILQTSPDNTLIIRKADPVAPKDWAATSPAWTIEDSGLFSDSESEDISSLYNVVTVTNQSATDSSIRFETEEIDRYRHRVKGYRVPWADFTLATSGGAWVTIENMGIVAEQIVETVEFIDGASSTTNPVYSATSAVWLRSQLGAITASEDGSLTSEVTGCSLAEVTYTTKYHAWIGRSDRDEEVQFYAVELP